MSRPAAGRYVLYNRILGAAGEKLAMTYQGGGKGVIVTPLNYAPSQIVRSPVIPVSVSSS